MIASAAARRVVSRRNNKLQTVKPLKGDNIEISLTAAGGVLVLYTFLVILYTIIDLLAIKDSESFNEGHQQLLGSYEVAKTMQYHLYFMNEIRILVMISTIATMVLTWGSTIYMDMYLIILPLSQLSLALAATEMAYFSTVGSEVDNIPRE